MAESENSKILWRGVMGGLLGNIAKSAVFWFYFSFIHTKASGYLDNPSAVGVFAFLGMPSAIVLSFIIVLVTRSIGLRTRRRIGILGGAAIGDGLIGVLVGILLLLPKMKFPLDNAFSWIFMAPFVGDFGLIIGAIAGMMAGQRKRKRFP